MGSEQKEDVSDTKSVAGEVVNFEEKIAELKQGLRWYLPIFVSSNTRRNHY